MKILVTGGNGNIAKMIKNNLSNEYKITNLSRQDLNVLSLQEIDKYLSINQFDILIHTAILGGRRTKDENGDVTHFNLLMFENLLKHADKFKMIINLDSAAIYDRSTDILNRKEEELFTVPSDYYGFSKYLIYQRSLQYNNVYNFRIFNIFHINEEPDRFIKRCFDSKKNNTDITIFEDKYFDFVYEDDFIKIVKYYFDNIVNPEKLQKTLNICYENKYKLSDIAKLIINDSTKINKIKDAVTNYSGDGSLLKTLNIELLGLEESLNIFALKTQKAVDTIHSFLPIE
jgi:GDP-L-fucose synthase